MAVKLVGTKHEFLAKSTDDLPGSLEGTTAGSRAFLSDTRQWMKFDGDAWVEEEPADGVTETNNLLQGLLLAQQEMIEKLQEVVDALEA